jgi:hypothetical protein
VIVRESVQRTGAATGRITTRSAPCKRPKGPSDHSFRNVFARTGLIMKRSKPEDPPTPVSRDAIEILVPFSQPRPGSNSIWAVWRRSYFVA